MSDVSESAHVNLVVADFALPDASGKTNLIGAGITALGFEAGQGVTSPFYVYVEVLVPGGLAPADAALELWLEDDAGSIVSIPGAAGPQSLRVGQEISFEKPRMPGLRVPDGIASRAQMVVGFQNGLTLAPGRAYRWVVRLDSDADRERRYPIAVPGPLPGPVVG